MAEFDWHAERGDLAGLAQLDRSPDDEGIDLKAVRQYRQAQVRREMGRHGIANSGAAGSVDYVLDTTSLPTNLAVVAALAGDTWYFQVWHREGMSDSNFTSAIQVDFQ